MPSKKCTKCRVGKPLDQFHRRSASADGRQAYCKECVRKPGSLASVKRPPFQPSRAEELAIVDLYVAGLTLAAIGNLYDANPKSIQYVLERQGIERRPGGYEPGKYTGSKNWNWKGGRSKTEAGYIRLRLDPQDPYVEMGSGPHRLCLEHRYVMAVHLGRALFPEEDVHHKNGVRDDNRLSNLELWSTSHPRGQRVSELLEWAEEILNKYNGQCLPDKFERV